MKPFDFVITFLSFIYALGLTHLLLAATHMIRHRSKITFSLPHALWMVVALMVLVGNWLSLWDFHTFSEVSLGAIAIAFAFSVNTYLLCGLVTPRLDGDDGFDLHVFHETQGKTYIVATVILTAIALAVNYAAGREMGVSNEANQNPYVLAMLVCAAAPLIVRARLIQVASPLLTSILMVVITAKFYPVIH